MTRLPILACAIAIVLGPSVASASGHGPLFGGATPTLGKGGWQLDQAWMGRLGDIPEADEQMLRTMISFGVTEDVQLSASLPIPLETSLYMPLGRMMSLMSTDTEFETTASWRFQRAATATGRRESTLMAGVTIPLQKFGPDGMLTAPAVNIAAATGYASRAHYFWVSGGYLHRGTSSEGDKRGNVAYYSVVYGYRPPALRLDYPKPDLRFFVEAVGERTGMAHHAGNVQLLFTGGHALFVGPTALLLYKAYALQGGMMFPAYQRSNGQPEERFRFGVNVSYFFWLK
jgi:hypothetical protein